MLTEREFKILNLLLNESKPINLSDLSNILNIGERSIRYDIDKINDYLTSKNQPLISKLPNGWFKIEESSTIRECIHNTDDLLYTSEIRRGILLCIIALSGEVNITKLAKDLDVSRTSIKSDLNEVKRILYSFNLNLCSNKNKGLKLIGNEYNIRMLQLKVLIDNLEGDVVKAEPILYIINTFLKNINFDIITDFISKIQDHLDIVLSDQSFTIIKYYIINSIIRIKNNQPLLSTNYSISLEKTVENLLLIKDMSFLEEHFEVKFNDMEIMKISEMIFNSNTFNFNEIPYEYWFQVEILVKDIIKNFSINYGLDLNDDKDLIKGLLTHLKATLYRLNNKIPLNISIYKDINLFYPDVYEIVDEVLKKYEVFVINKISDDEISLISIYFKLAIDKNKHKVRKVKNILIVCREGYGTSKLLLTQLKDNYNVNVIDTIPLNNLKKYSKINDIDLIISTFKLDNRLPYLPTIKVNTVLNNSDIEILKENGIIKTNKHINLSKILSIISASCEIQNLNKLKNNLMIELNDYLVDDTHFKKQNLVSLLPIENINVNADFNTWEEAIGFSGEILKNNNYVTDSYVKTLIKAFAEYGSYMIIGDGIAIPHTRNENSVLKTGFSLVILKNYITSKDNKKIKIIFTFSSIDNTEHIEALSEFANLINNKIFILDLVKVENSFEALELIRKYQFST